MVYDKEYYQKNKDRFLEWQKKYRLNNKEKVRANRIRYDAIYVPLNRDKILARKKQYRLKNNDKLKEYRRRSEVKQKERERQKTPHYKETKKQYQKGFYLKNRKRILAYGKKHSQILHVKARRNEMSRIWRKNNPRSNRSLYPELQEAMNNVRIRDKNTCQWQGCGVTFRQTEIHVNHIFPRSEYPDLELVEQYMICYCPNHHSYWHRMRGDPYHGMIYPSHEYMRANPDELLLGGD